jgi:Protein of unknown function (DUF3037)
MTQAFYTLIQVIPDRLRDERINAALILQSPESRYSGMRVRKWMDKILRQVFPEIDSESIRLILRGIQNDFSKFDYERDLNPLFSFHDGDLMPYDIGFLDKYRNPYSPIQFSDSKSLTISENQSLVAKADQLYQKLIAFPRQKIENQNITKEVLTRNVLRFLHEKQVSIEEKPPVFQGILWRNKFDALKRKNNRRHLQFISFDISEAPIVQAKAYLASVQDMQQRKDLYSEDEFACIIQPPKLNRQLNDEYKETVKTFSTSGIVTFETHTDEILRLISGLNNENGLRAALN